MEIRTVLVVVGAIAALGYLAYRSSGSRSTAESELLLLCHGDRALMERLIAHQLRKVPGRPRSQSVSAAIHAIRRDRR